MTAAPRWDPEEGALDLLESLGGPFDGREYRQTVTTTLAGWRDASFAASLPDGRRAAIALLADDRHAESLPPEAYGGVVATAPLSPTETASFLRLARRRARVPVLDARGVLLDDGSQGAAARRIAIASVVRIQAEQPPEAGFSRLTRRSVKKATQAGAVVTRARDAERFLPLYEHASAEWATRYPHELIRALGSKGLAAFHEVALEGSVVASLMTITGGSHWMCWLAAQNEAGRAVAASYLAYQAVFAEARAEGVPAVNLGASAPGSGGMEFKKRLGAVEVPIVAWRISGTWARLRRIAVGGALTRMRSAPSRSRS